VRASRHARVAQASTHWWHRQARNGGKGRQARVAQAGMHKWHRRAGKQTGTF